MLACFSVPISSVCDSSLTSPLQIIILGKIADELFLKVVELKKIQGNVQLGAMKCQTREFLSFCPMVREGVRL